MEFHSDKAAVSKADTRKPYASPKLEVFGEVAALTAAGSVAPKESNGGMKAG